MDKLIDTIMNRNPDIPKVPDQNQLLLPNTQPTPSPLNQSTTQSEQPPNPEPVSETTVKDTPKTENGLTPEPIVPKKFESDNRDLAQMIQNIMGSNMPQEQKLQLLTMVRGQLVNPGSGEKDKLNQLNQKYDPSQQMIQHQQMMSSYPYQIPNYQQPIIPPYHQHQPMLPQHPQMPPYQQSMMGMQSNNYQFDILKNKLDTIQMEMIDITRHLKDYTKRYMNAVREDDMAKLDVYIRDLIGVNKDVEKAQQAINQEAKMREEILEPELQRAQEEQEKGLVGKAADGVKDFMGSIGKNFGAITDVVSNVTNQANSTLSKQLMPNKKKEGTTTNTKTPTTELTTTNKSTPVNQTTPITEPNTTNTSETKKESNKNIVSVEDYINEMSQNNQEQNQGNKTEEESNEKEEPQSEEAEEEEPQSEEDKGEEPQSEEGEEEEPQSEETEEEEPKPDENEEEEPESEEAEEEESNEEEEPKQDENEEEEPDEEEESEENKVNEGNLTSTMNELDEKIKKEINVNLGNTKPNNIKQTGGTRKKVIKKKKRTKKRMRFNNI